MFKYVKDKYQKHLFVPDVHLIILTPVEGTYQKKETKNGTLFMQKMHDKHGNTFFSYGLLCGKELIPVTCKVINKAFNINLIPVIDDGNDDTILDFDCAYLHPNYFVALDKADLQLPDVLEYKYGCEIYLKKGLPLKEYRLIFFDGSHMEELPF